MGTCGRIQEVHVEWRGQGAYTYNIMGLIYRVPINQNW